MDIDRPVTIGIDSRKFDNNSQADTVQNVKKRISHKALKNAIINEEISSAENLQNQDLSIYQMKNEQSDYGNNGLELSPDEQAERVNLLLLGFASLIFMNTMAVLIISFVKLSKYEGQLVMDSKIIQKQTKGMLLMTRLHLLFSFFTVFIKTTMDYLTTKMIILVKIRD